VKQEPKTKDRVTGDSGQAIDVIATLLQAARDDSVLRRRLEFLLRLPSLQRESLVNTAVEEMRLRRESAADRAAFAALATDAGAAAARRVLKMKSV
jgi:hypothetical protein